MKKRIFILISMLALMCCLFAIGASAASTNEFGSVEKIDGIDLTDMNADASSRVVIVDASGEYHTYPAQYVVSSNTKFYYNFKPINDALGTSYTKNSVVRIEVPDNITIATNCGDLSQTSNLVEIKFSANSELHTLEYGCFYANKKLEKLNIPKNVTTIGTLIINNSTLKELVFDDGFSAYLPKDSFKGASGVERVVFSNQMTSVGDRAFDSTLGVNLKELYLGASLKDLGTNNMAWVKQSVKIYMPAQFLSEVDTITMETFSWWNSSACLPTGVIFYTGSLAQMEALIAKSTYDRVISSKATLVEWDLTKTDDEYVPSSGWTIVYGYNKCNAFYGGKHDEQALNGCQFGCARGCGVVDVLENPMHEYETTVTYGGAEAVDYYKAINVCEACKNCGSESLNKDIEPLFSDKGYSVDLEGVGVCQSFKVNFDAIELYKQYVNGDFEYGLVASIDNENPLVIDNGAVKTVGKAISTGMTNTSFELLQIKVVGIPAEQENAQIVGCAYALDNGKIYYLSENATTQVASGASYASFKEQE